MSDGPYDPNALEGEKPQGHQYVSLKDLRTLAICGVVAAPFMFFGYGILRRNSDRHVCISDLRAIYTAVNLYADQHDNRFPPIARTELDGVTPSLDETGRPYTWVSDTAPFMSTRQSFLCPTATAVEAVKNESPDSTTKSVPSAYGMYAPYGGVLTSLVETPEQVVLIAETSDRGANGTLDPKPFGKDVPDGFVIGWTSGNTTPNTAALKAATKRVTRLAFPGMGTGTATGGRHDAFIQALSASGELLYLHPDDAQFHTGGGTNPHWRLPPGY